MMIPNEVVASMDAPGTGVKACTAGIGSPDNADLPEHLTCQ